MPRQFSNAVRSARANALESTVGASAVLRFYSGSPPADCATAPSGTLLVSITLPSDWMGAASNGVIAKAGTWQRAQGGGGTAGIIGYYRIWDSGVTTCHEQGTVTETGLGGDMEVDNTDVAVDQAVTVTAFGWTEPNV